MSMSYTREDIANILNKGIYTVSFTKVNGERRDMRCTLKNDLIPETQSDTQTETRKVNEDVLAVWDLEKSGWRSFRLDSLISILQE